MPPSSKAPAVDKAYCERTCRVAKSLGWELHHSEERHAYFFTAPNGKTVEGAGYLDKAAALTSACRCLAEVLV